MLAQTVSAPKPATAPPAAQPPTLPANAGGPSFAQFLTDQTSLPTPPAPAAPASAAHDDSVADAEQPAPKQAAARRAAPQPAKPTTPNRSPDGAAKADAKAAPAGGADAAAGSVRDGEEDAPETPELKEFTQLIGMATPQADAATPRPDSLRHRAAATGKDSDDTAQGRMGLKAVAGDGRSAREALDAASKPADTRADKPSTRPVSDALQMTTQPADTETPMAATAPPAAPSFAATLVQAQAQAATMPGVLPADAGARPSYADMQAPLHSAAFAPELGARVSLMAVDGVQQAQLQLNPADMGPVSVQIVVDGGQAQVSFHAAQAETRQALEQSLPDLAAALQGQGLTLSGGGVFQQARRDADGAGQPGQDDTPASGRGGGGAAGATTTSTLAAPPRRTVGLVDTFA